MSYWDDEPYYEPTVADDIFFEASERLKNALKNDIKRKMDNLLEENNRLTEENKKMKDKVSNIEWREKSLENKEKDMERNVLRKKFSEMISPLEEKMLIWRIEYGYVQGEKCDKCNENRMIGYKTPSGKQLYEDCKCAKRYTYYYPSQTEIVTLALYKDRNYPYNISVTPKYDDASYDDTYCKFELKQHIENLDDFENEDSELFAEIDDMSKWDYKNVGFARQEDCQRFADYLNENNGLPEKIIRKASTKIPVAPKKIGKRKTD